jgi:hypothetical protein
MTIRNYAQERDRLFRGLYVALALQSLVAVGGLASTVLGNASSAKPENPNQTVQCAERPSQIACQPAQAPTSQP